MASKTKDNAIQVAKNVYNKIFVLHELPNSIVSDRDSQFLSE